MRLVRSRLKPVSFSTYLAALSGLFLLSAPTAQSQPSIDGEGFTSFASPVPDRATAGEFNIVAIRVEFQPDTTEFTSGDGTFAGDPFNGLVPRVDPLPHDEAFFQAHLDAAKHYLETVSDGQLTVTSHLVSGVVRVSQRMQAYSPIGENSSSDEQMSKLAALIREAWTLADAQLQPDLGALDADRTFFVIFHAGIGRDIELVGTTLDKTPLDLPSVYFDDDALSRLGAFGLTFGALPVTNTAIVPRSESRLGFDFFADQPFVVDLSTNGLLAASFLNFLGVPDLFDTRTGQSAIGPFGIMDPLGIFAYGGILPPEPSAWTKLFLGWTTPIEIRGGTIVQGLRAVGESGSSDVARVWISPSEYFLVENRNRDPDGDGLRLDVWKDGAVAELRVDNGDPEFNSVTIEGFSGGVVVGADTYDWALPGGLDENGNELNGGILIWHVDERRIAAGIATNTVNADPERRGVDLEEADSGQDLGFPQGGFLGPQLDLGSPFDFFYLDNPVTVLTSSGREVRLYRNRFGPDTFPNSNTNGGGPSFTVIENFSAPGATMSFDVRFEAAEGIAPVGAYSVDLETFVGLSITAGAERFVKLGGSVEDPFLAVTYESVGGPEQGFTAFVDDSGILSYQELGHLTKPGIVAAGTSVWGLGLIVPVSEEAGAFFLMGYDPREDSFAFIDLDVSDADFEPTGTLMRMGDEIVALFRGDGSGLMALIDWRGGTYRVVNLDREPVAAVRAGPDRVAVSFANGTIEITDLVGNTMGPTWDISASGLPSPYGMAFGADADGLLGAIVGTDARLAVLQPEGGVRVVDPAAVFGLASGTPDGLRVDPVLADLDNDGRLDILFQRGRQLLAFTRGGAVVVGFPIEVEAKVVAQLLVGELTPSGGVSVVAAGDDGYLHAFDLGLGGRPVPGFPLALGPGVETTPLVSENRLYAVSTGGNIRGWDLSGVGAVMWGQRFGDASNSAFVDFTATDPPPLATSSLLVASETYNWPNPIRDGRTNFRTMATEDCAVRITIVDMAGGMIDQIDATQIAAGSPHEILWTTDVASGVYFARVTARTDSGREESTIVKVAVLR